ncbi:MAG: MBL fold metallo-hydrolase [Rhodospirillaceae bacterium]
MVTSSKSETDGLEFPWAVAPEPGQAIEVATGVHWIRMPLPFALDHINLWILEDIGGVALVDSGFASEVTQTHWHSLLNTQFSGQHPRKLICTHHHPDHMGLAGWLTSTFDIPLWTTQDEWAAFHRWSDMSTDDVVEVMRGFYVKGGVPHERQDSDLKRRQGLSQRRKTALSGFERVQDGDDLIINNRSWRVIVGTGHAPELAALYRAEDGVLISGDQVLPRISPNVSVMPFALDADPLKDFLDSLAKFRQLPSGTLVLPSHKLPFYGLHERIDALSAHHMDRLDDALKACQQPVTAADATTVLFPRALNDHQYFFALGETLAHLNCLWHDKQVLRTTSDSGAYIFEAV